MSLDSLNELLVSELKDLYSAESQLLKAIPKMIKSATSADLRKGFELHLEQTKVHVERLEKIGETLDFSPKGKKCKAMEGLLEEAKEILAEEADPAVLDAALIAAAQKVEHYEIASYGTARTWAEQLGQATVAGFLQQTLDEEKATDVHLSQLAYQTVNEEAAEVG